MCSPYHSLTYQFLGEAIPLWAWPFFRRQERSIFTLRNRGLENNNLKIHYWKVLGKKFTLCRCTLPGKYRAAHCLAVNAEELGISKCCYKRRWNTDFSHSRWNLHHVLGLFSYWILPQTAFLMQQQGTEYSWKESALLNLMILLKFFVFPYYLKYCKIVQVTAFMLHSWRCTLVLLTYVWFNDCVGDWLYHRLSFSSYQ